ncbi:MAG: hypothetical protein WCT05_13655 [Lentisphaeria bacterium]
MKSAYELAMERFGGSVQQFSAEQKEQLSEVERVYEAKIAQAKFAAGARLEACHGDPEKTTQVQADLVVELRSLETRRERKKEDLRNEFKRS